jgi:hypothetical protein
MFKKILLAGALILVGSLSGVQTAEAHGPFGSYRSFGTFGPSFHSVGPVYRSARPVIVSPAPIYHSQRVYAAYPQYNYGFGFGPPVYQSYRSSVGVGVGNFGYPVYGPAFGTPRGFSLYIGP